MEFSTGTAVAIVGLLELFHCSERFERYSLSENMWPGVMFYIGCTCASRLLYTVADYLWVVQLCILEV